ncbi:MAG: hypothetical protein IJV88_02000 [Ruminococcus sp.]|nr:hypothetical protein [Ruminococcus sp.]
MTALDSMLCKLQPVGIYSLGEDSNIFRELSAYGESLDMVQDELNRLLGESFFATAESYGLERAERVVGACRADLPTEKRRNMLCVRWSYGGNDFTPEGVRKILTMLGVEGHIIEYPHVQRLSVELTDSNLTPGQRTWVLSQLRALLPAHLEVDALFGGFCWDVADARGLSFGEIDSKAYTWDYIDIHI